MAERPILFSAPMVRAILDGRKTQTRRVVKPQPVRDAYNGSHGDLVMWEGRIERLQIDPKDERRATTVPVACPYGVPGDTLWVRETWLQFAPKPSSDDGLPANACISYRADYSPRDLIAGVDSDGDPFPAPKWRPSIFMPRWASRITLLVKSVRVERLQEISEADARAEGIEFQDDEKDAYRGWKSFDGTCLYETALESFRKGWDTINGKRAPWASNPWVFVVEFERINQ